MIRRALSYSLLFGSLWLGFLVLIEVYFYHTLPFANIYCWMGYMQCWGEGLLFVACGISLGVSFGLLLAWRTARHESASPASTTYGVMGRTCLVGLGVSIAVIATSPILPRARVCVAGWLRCENCHAGLPVSYWISELRLAGIATPGLSKAANEMFHPTNLPIVYVSKILVEDFGEDAMPGLVGLLDDSQRNVRLTAIRAFEMSAGWKSEAVPIPALITAFEKHHQKKNWDEAIQLTVCLGHFGPRANDAFSVLLKAQTSENGNVIGGAAQALWSINPQAASKAGVFRP